MLPNTWPPCFTVAAYCGLWVTLYSVLAETVPRKTGQGLLHNILFLMVFMLGDPAIGTEYRTRSVSTVRKTERNVRTARADTHSPHAPPLFTPGLCAGCWRPGRRDWPCQRPCCSRTGIMIMPAGCRACGAAGRDCRCLRPPATRTAAPPSRWARARRAASPGSVSGYSALRDTRPSTTRTIWPPARWMRRACCSPAT